MPKFRRVTGLFRAATPDGPDTDYTPELEALNGQIEFIPRHRGGVIAYPHLDPPEFVRPEPIQAVLQDGYVMTQVSVGEETVIQPVELLVSDDDEATQSWQWEAVFRDIRVGRWGDEITISPLRFTVPDEDGPLDLTEVVGEKSGGTITVKGPRGEGLADIIVDGTTLTLVWDGGRRRTVTVPTVRGIGVPDGGSPGQVVMRTSTGAEWAPVDLGKATVGELDGARIKPGTLTADKVLIGGAGNLLTNPGFAGDGTGWSIAAYNPIITDSGGPTGEPVLSIEHTGSGAFPYLGGLVQSAAGSFAPDLAAVEAGKRYSASVWVRPDRDVTAGQVGIGGRLRQLGASTLGWTSPSAATNREVIPANTWAKIEAEVRVPEGTGTWNRLAFGLRISSETPVGTRVEFSAPVLLPMVGTTLIEDGAITTEKIAAGAITEDKLAPGIIARLEARIAALEA